nr:retrotransposon protein, putative, Ty1-copia subclass [Tanacetum cinerariifolium]
MAHPVQNINHSAFRSMFEIEKLYGNNFNDWFRQLKLVLRVEKKMYVTEQPLPAAPAADSAANMQAEWNAIYDAYNEVACLILGSMNFELYRQFENSSPYDIIKELKSMFEKQAGVERPTGTSWLYATTRSYSGSYLEWPYQRFCGISKDKTCHHCKEVGYWKRNCPVYLAELLKKKKQVGSASSLIIFTIKLFAFHNKSWVYDTGCGTHICITKQGYREARKLKEGALYLYVDNGVRAQVEAIGCFDLVFPNGLVICLDNCHYAPSITRGVVSICHLIENGFVQCFMDFGISVSKNNVFYFNAILSNGIYEIDMHDLVPNDSSIYNVSTKRAKHDLDCTYLWHGRLAHISKKRIEKLQQEELLKSTDDESFDQCVSCLSGKMTGKSFPRHPKRETDLLRIIHTDVCVPLRHVSRQGASYFITLTDDYSCHGYVYLLKHKHEVFETFKVFKNEVENQLGKKIKALRSDRGYPKEIMGYYFYFPPENKIVVARYAEFFKKNLITQEVSGRAIDLKEIQDKDTSPSEITSKIPMEVEGFEPPQEEVIPIRRSERTHQALNRLCLNVEVEEHSLGDLNETASYKAAMLDSESNK